MDKLKKRSDTINGDKMGSHFQNDYYSFEKKLRNYFLFQTVFLVVLFKRNATKSMHSVKKLESSGLRPDYKATYNFNAGQESDSHQKYFRDVKK